MRMRVHNGNGADAIRNIHISDMVACAEYHPTDTSIGHYVGFVLGISRPRSSQHPADMNGQQRTFQ